MTIHVRSTLYARIFVALMILGMAGCGETTYDVYPVEGKVVFQDGQSAKELAGGAVELEMVDKKLSCRGEIQKDGTFRLSTYKFADGAPAGHYRVMVEPPTDADPAAAMDDRFQNAMTSGLEVTVEPKENQLTISVERAKR